MDVKAFSPLMHDIGQRFLALESLMHAEQHHQPEARDDKEPRLLTLARPGGGMNRHLFWIDKSKETELQSAVEDLAKQYPNQETLKTLFVLLGEHLLGNSELKK